MTCLHVSNLSSKVTSSDLKDLFERHGAIDYANICMEPRTIASQGKVSRGFGFVKYKHHDDAEQALQALQDHELFGKRMKLEYSKRADPRQKTPGHYAGFVARRRSRSRSYRRRRSTSSESYSRSYRRHRFAIKIDPSPFKYFKEIIGEAEVDQEGEGDPTLDIDDHLPILTLVSTVDGITHPEAGREAEDEIREDIELFP